ncbi:grasp-with-spasm system ATP-grasp peptide maturase [Sinomicrobium oceani]|uniref:grasp-with-spasm system ATP-grasp peptide maturase n=1 Tax=Sinomicrobium oceani TaxID=1150368 RepID=UPI00227C5A85|nr:grasp-with-spasm system ATP-grasp peptide maturase [Sinomicrobium oceani]
MILLLSRQDDGSTAFVVQWLLYLNKKYKRLNGDTDRVKIVGVDMQSDAFILEENGNTFNLFDFDSVWYRRRGMSIKNTQADTGLLNEVLFTDNEHYHKRHVNEELKELIAYAHHIVEKKSTRQLGGHMTSAVNKFKVLDLARDCGLKIPKTFVVTSKDEILKIMEKEGNVVTKAMSQGIYFFTRKRHYYSYTERLTPDAVRQLPDVFFPSLLQAEIKKKYELRIFFLKEEYYAMAIFSQNDSKTEVDFRKKTEDSQVRNVPYRLPEHIREKLIEVAAKLRLDTGSFDMIVDTDNNYIFLEVNPLGQFSMTSFPCNYYLEKKIAETL